jgi:hypothetical protein
MEMVLTRFPLWEKVNQDLRAEALVAPPATPLCAAQDQPGLVADPRLKFPGFLSVVASAHLPADAPAVLLDHPSDVVLADAIEVVDAPVELLQRRFGRPPDTN